MMWAELEMVARGIAGALRETGPLSYEQVVQMIQRRGLTTAQASAVLALGIATGILVRRVENESLIDAPQASPE